MAIWMRPSGKELETNDLNGTIEHCVNMGWKRVDGESSVDKLSAKDIKVILADLEIEYTSKADAIKYLKSNGYD